MSNFKFINVRRYKRGAKHSDGSPWYCVRCGITRTRRRQATVTAQLTRRGSRFKLPVGYCDQPIPAEVQP